MGLLSLFGCCKKATIAYPQDKVIAKDGSEIVFTFFAHASFAIEHNGKHIYIDPVGDFAWEKLPKADAILITHSHYDHFEIATVEKIAGEKCAILCDKTSAGAFEHDCTTMLPGCVRTPQPRFCRRGWHTSRRQSFLRLLSRSGRSASGL